METWMHAATITLCKARNLSVVVWTRKEAGSREVQEPQCVMRCIITWQFCGTPVNFKLQTEGWYTVNYWFAR